jgi:hypothetical protein
LLALTGTVRGDVRAVPASLSFGSIVQGHEVKRRIKLVAEKPGAFTDLEVASASPWLSLGLWTSDPAAPQSASPAGAGTPAAGGKDDPSMVRHLDVVLSSYAPPGPLQSEVMIRLANGQQLVLEISAFIIGSQQ